MKLSILKRILVMVIILFLTSCKTENDQLDKIYYTATEESEPKPLITSISTISKKAFDYSIKEDDTLISIAEKFSVDPQTILYANPSLFENLSNLTPGTIIRVPPIDGYYYIWQDNDTIELVAEVYSGNIEDILFWNQIERVDEGSGINIPSGTEIFIPYGHPQYQSSPP
jgi:hypothetical protein